MKTIYKIYFLNYILYQTFKDLTMKIYLRVPFTLKEKITMFKLTFLLCWKQFK